MPGIYSTSVTSNSFGAAELHCHIECGAGSWRGPRRRCARAAVAALAAARVAAAPPPLAVWAPVAAPQPAPPPPPAARAAAARARWLCHLQRRRGLRKMERGRLFRASYYEDNPHQERLRKLLTLLVFQVLEVVLSSLIFAFLVGNGNVRP